MRERLLMAVLGNENVQFCQPEDFVYVSVTWVSLHPGNNSRMNLKFSYYAEEYMSVSGSTYAQQAYLKLDSLFKL